MSVGRIPVPPPHPDLCLSYNEVVRHEERLNGAACLHPPYLPIGADARADLMAEFPDGPLGPLLVHSYPGVD